MTNGKGNIIPSMKYRNAPEAIAWLCKVFGFQKRVVVPGESEGVIAHAQLSLGNGMIMLGTAGEESEFEKLVGPPEKGRRLTGAPYIVVDDIDAHYDRAKNAGAGIVMALEEQHYGGKLYAARDPEGYVWCFGSYDPWAEH